MQHKPGHYRLPTLAFKRKLEAEQEQKEKEAEKEKEKERGKVTPTVKEKAKEAIQNAGSPRKLAPSVGRRESLPQSPPELVPSGRRDSLLLPEINFRDEDPMAAVPVVNVTETPKSPFGGSPTWSSKHSVVSTVSTKGSPLAAKHPGGGPRGIVSPRRRVSPAKKKVVSKGSTKTNAKQKTNPLGLLKITMGSSSLRPTQDLLPARAFSARRGRRSLGG